MLSAFKLVAICAASNFLPTWPNLGHKNASVIPIMSNGFNLIVVSFCGSGKTSSYQLSCLLDIVEYEPLGKGEGPYVIILVNTFELAEQTLSKLRLVTKFYELGIELLAGYDTQPFN